MFLDAASGTIPGPVIPVSTPAAQPIRRVLVRTPQGHLVEQRAGPVTQASYPIVTTSPLVSHRQGWFSLPSGCVSNDVICF